VFGRPTSILQPIEAPRLWLCDMSFLRQILGGTRGNQQTGFDQEIGHDVSIDDGLTVFDLERVQLNEEGEVAGLAATIGNDGLEMRTSRVPEE
jgi:hypothetical protein